MTENLTMQNIPGLKQNWKQFSLLVLINAFVGGMVGLERTILPEIAETDFGIAAKTAIFSFIIVFGITKALANYFAGRFSQQFGRKKMLVIGWLFGLPVPFILMLAPDWNWIVFANILLGINQGLSWSANVIMKIDLAGEKDRGLAMGLNEFAGYLAVAIVAFLTGWIASEYGLRPYPFYIGIFMAVLGLIMSIFLVRDTAPFVQHESKNHKTDRVKKNLFWEVSFKDSNLRAISQGGMITNFTDGLAWGAFPIFLASAGLSLTEIGIVVGVYPAFWGMLQIVTGKLSDYTGRKKMLWAGMLVQALSLIAFPMVDQFVAFIIISALLGTGTAMVYPTFLAAVADLVHPEDRAESIGVYRLWRDAGYAFGAIFSGIIADLYNISMAITITGYLTLISAIWLYVGLKKLNNPVLNNSN
ncbi:MFS transporter [Gracilimonas mengyeensis]|uniref:Predicted arabinose efflux permease, MFS family n=1 Tax=Gracilimonas mengyeensis TaxID=1302730 RepID=A0A521D1L7_9BACT|nr:MFS transporter [Gracilimonas mengyeensis]SMO65589.1 Predicted arabinose efflux permease, MFS family [Gracilimonas mengyeensis]